MEQVYMLRAGSTHYKVGITTNIAKRMRAIQTANQHKIELVVCKHVEKARIVEQELHDWLYNHKTDGGTEWFELTPELALELVEKITNTELDNDMSAFLSYRDVVVRQTAVEKSFSKFKAEILKTVAYIENKTEVLRMKEEGFLVKKEPKPPFDPDAPDEFFDDAVKEVRRAGKASASLLQRRLRVGYARAARLLDELEHAGVVSAADGARPREVLDDNKVIHSALV